MTASIGELRACGADVDGALERFMDDEELYLECLALFRDDPARAGLATAVAAGDARAAFEAGHTLKGVAANLGLVPVSAVLSEWVELLRASSLEGAAARLQALDRAFEDLPL